MHKCLSWGPGALEVFQGPSSTMSMTPSKNILPGMLGSLKHTGHSEFYWIPSVVNFPGVDSILGDSRGNLFTLHATIAEDPMSPEAGIKRVWVELLLVVQTRCTWHYITVTKTEAEAAMYRVRFSTLLKSFRLDSAQVCGFAAVYYTCNNRDRIKVGVMSWYEISATRVLWHSDHI